MAALSIHERLMDSIAALVLAEALDGLGGRVHRRKLPDKAAVRLPCVLVTLEGSRPKLHPLTTEEDERVLPVGVLLLTRADLRDSGDLPRWLAWLEGLHDALLMQLYEDVEECWHADVEPMDAVDAMRAVGPAYQEQASGLLVLPRVVTTRRRPNG